MRTSLNTPQKKEKKAEETNEMSHQKRLFHCAKLAWIIGAFSMCSAAGVHEFKAGVVMVAEPVALPIPFVYEMVGPALDIAIEVSLFSMLCDLTRNCETGRKDTTGSGGNWKSLSLDGKNTFL